MEVDFGFAKIEIGENMSEASKFKVLSESAHLVGGNLSPSVLKNDSQDQLSANAVQLPHLVADNYIYIQLED